MERTITVKSWAGEKQVTQDQFVATWKDQLSTLWCICNDEHDHSLREGIMTDLEFIARKHFNLECERQGVLSEQTIALKEFVDYVMSFYGEGGVYDLHAADKIPQSLDRSDVADVCKHYMTVKGSEFEGDTVDREQVLPLIINLVGAV